jgi:hypothetical protein
LDGGKPDFVEETRLHFAFPRTGWSSRRVDAVQLEFQLIRCQWRCVKRAIQPFPPVSVSKQTPVQQGRQAAHGGKRVLPACPHGFGLLLKQGWPTLKSVPAPACVAVAWAEMTMNAKI